MNIIIPTKAITIHLWGNRVGVLLFGDDGYSRFQYFPEFAKHGVEIAPFALPLSNRVYNSSEEEFFVYDDARRAMEIGSGIRPDGASGQGGK